MAAAPLQGLCEEATCSICLEFFHDPVTIACGHNFCRPCLTQYWERSGTEEISCPECRGKVGKKLLTNWKLANVVELTRELLQQEKKSPQRKWGVCARHQEPLKLFCTDDETSICLVCDRSKKHRDHQVVPVEEVTQDYRDLIYNRLEVLEMMRGNNPNCKAKREDQRQLFEQAKAELEETKKQFRGLHSFLNEQEKRIEACLEEEDKEMEKKIDEHLAIYSRELFCLEGLIQDMEEKCRQPTCDLLKDVGRILQRYEKKEKLFWRFIKLSTDLNIMISQLHCRNGLLVCLITRVKDNLLSRPGHQRAYVTLDPDTAHLSLTVSEDCKSVICRGRWQPPYDGKTFHVSPYVLGRELFTEGRSCWAVTVGEEGDWAVGVARASVESEGIVELSSKVGIWAIGKYTLQGGRSEYRASNHPHYSVLSPHGNLRTIVVSLNYEEAEVAFHDGDTGSHLFTFFLVSFMGSTLPFFRVGSELSLPLSPA